MKTTWALILYFFVLTFIHAQDPKWINLTGDDVVESISITGDTIWVASNGGITLINRADESIINHFNSANSGMDGNCVRELVASQDGKAWFTGCDFWSGVPSSNIQYFDGENIVDAAENLEALDGTMSKLDFNVTANGDLYFLEGSSKIWKLSDMVLTEIKLAAGYTYCSDLFVDTQGNLFVRFGEDDTSVIGMHKDELWTTFDIAQWLSWPVQNNSYLSDWGVGPDQNLYMTFCVNSFDCNVLRFDYSSWEMLTQVSDNYDSFFWSPGGDFYLISAFFEELCLVTDWSDVNCFGGSISMGNLNGQTEDLIWTENDEFWSVNKGLLYKSELLLMGGSGAVMNPKKVKLGNSPFASNRVAQLGIGKAAQKIIQFEDDQIWSFDGSQGQQLNFDNFEFPFDDFPMRIVSNIKGVHYLYGWGQRILKISENSLSEHIFSGFQMKGSFIDKDDNLIYDAADHDHLMKLDTFGNLVETDIPRKGSNTYLLDTEDKIWVFEEAFPDDRSLYYDDDQWNILDFPLTAYFASSDPVPYVDNDDNLCYVDAGKKFLRYDQQADSWAIDTLPENYNGSPQYVRMIQDSKGNYWIMSTSGLFKFNVGGWTHYDHLNSGLSSTRYTDFDIDELDNLWIATDFGLSIFNEEGITSLGDSPFSRIEGHVYFHVDDDGIFTDTVDADFEYVQLDIDPLENSLFTNSTGKYGANLLNGDYEVILQPIEHWSAEGGNEKQVTVAAVDQLNVDFKMVPDTIFTKGEVNIAGGLPVCDRVARYYFAVRNSGTSAFDGRLIIKLPQLGELFSSEPALQFDMLENIYYYDFQNFLPFETMPLVVDYQVPDFQFTGDTLNWSAKVQELDDGMYLDQDSTFLQQIVLCSYDPNDKLVQVDGPVQDGESLLQDELIYTVRFQNTGNFQAERVEVIDTLDEQFDMSTFRLLQASHPVDITIKQERVVHFLFDGINLPDSTSNELESHGLVQFAIKVKQDLTSPVQVHNTASIYFDTNPPILTNEVENVLVESFPVSVTSIRDEFSFITIFPNPTEEKISLTLSSPGDSVSDISIYDLNGQLVKSHRIMPGQGASEIDLAALAAGVYWLKASNQKGTDVEKVIKL